METSREGGKKLWAAEGGCDGGRNDRGRDTNSPAGSLAGINNIRRAAEHSGLAAPPSGGRDGEGGDAAAEDGKEECRESLFISLLSPHFCFFQFKEEGRGKGVESEMRRRTRL